MALKGLDIYKNLPRENCKECGVPTCLAFAMKVAAGQAKLEDCPRLSKEAQAELSEASAPPQRLVKLGADPHPIELGQETVLFRHEEKFHHPTAVALRLSDAAGEEEIKKACSAFLKLQFTRVGQVLKPEMIALVNESQSPDKFRAAAQIIRGALGVPMVLMSDSAETLGAVAKALFSGCRPLLYCTGDASVETLAALRKETGSPLCVAGSLESVAERVKALADKGVKDVIISAGAVSLSEALVFSTQTRRAALGKKFRPLGCPVLAMACGEDKAASALDACVHVSKYAAVVVSDAWEPHLLLPILTARQNIYTDPQKPVQMVPGLYDVGEVTQESPLLVTTNFSLSYYSVEGEVESSRIPCRILAVDTEGTSVLTAWAADKFNSETITAALKKFAAAEKVNHNKLVLPGHVAVIAATLAEDSGWKVLVGPREASGIGPFLKNSWKKDGL